MKFEYLMASVVGLMVFLAIAVTVEHQLDASTGYLAKCKANGGTMLHARNGDKVCFRPEAIIPKDVK